MSFSYRRQLVFTRRERCRVCYTCLRECPVKAIKIINGQAEVINDRCIGCGVCVPTCTSEAITLVQKEKTTEPAADTMFGMYQKMMERKTQTRRAEKGL